LEGDGLFIREMKHTDLDFAVQSALSVGWPSETREMFESFIQFDPNGSFIVEHNGNAIGLCSNFTFEKHGFFGELIIDQRFRGQGIGARCLEHSIDYLKGRGVEHIYLDSVPKAFSLYERFGFRTVCRSLRFSGEIRRRSHPQVRSMTQEDLKIVCQMDFDAFGADRSFFLKRQFTLHPELCRILIQEEKIGGFIMARPYDGRFFVGPWVILPFVVNPEILLEGLFSKNVSETVRIGTLELNSRAVSTIRSLGLKEQPDPPLRMVLGKSHRLGNSEACFAIGSGAKG
jgi:ribosomal protein S18 acetylase RimI-like enzyme